ncbi:MAG: T9SS type A sorting domain-containing protein [Bacteroidetes bacterium]|nr:T9SS type A sorting domain-containing protein [Bacteroidota bacterium]
MKRGINLFLLVFIIININCFASLRQTECNGAWSNPKIWQFGIIPGANDSILIKHFVAMDTILSTQNNFIVITEHGELCSQYAIIVNAGSKVYNYGSICASSFVLNDTLIDYGVIKTMQFVISGYLEILGSVIVGPYTCFGQASCTPIIFKQGDTLVSNTEAFEYDWYKNNQSLSIDSIMILPTQTGYYKLRIKKTNTDEFSNFSDSVYVVISSTSVNNIFQNKNQIEISQQMENNLLKIVIKNPCSNKYNIEIYNLLGIKISDAVFMQNYTIQFNNFTKGYYIYKISDGINIKSGTFIVR